ncbi:MAG: amidase, partial [Mesorhizobium sp.]
AETVHAGDTDEITIALEIEAAEPEATVKVHVNGERVIMQADGNRYTGHAVVTAATHQGFHSVWRGAYGSIVTAIAKSPDGRAAGAYVVTGGIG